VSPPADDGPDVITAALLQITQQAERLAVLDEREAAHHRQIAAGLAELAGRVADTSAQVGRIDSAATRRAGILDALDRLDQQVAALASRLTEMAVTPDADGENGGQYRPPRSPRWWKLDGPERDEALARLRAWVEQVYRPGYGHLAAGLGACWDRHPLCLFGLDWLMELWSALYLTTKRNAPALASQAEWQTRLLPALAEQMYIETTHCQHAERAPSRRLPPPTVGAGSNGRDGTNQKPDPTP